MRCVSPAARNCSVSSGGTPRVSPSRKPASSARSTGCRWVEPASTSRRNPLAERSSGARAGPTPTISVACTSPTACFHRQRRSKPSRSVHQPRRTTDSPADKTRSCPATSPDADTSTRRPPAVRPSNESTRTSTRVSNRPASGSSTSVATTRASACATIAAASGEAVSPWSARCMTAAPSSANASAATTHRPPTARTHTAMTHMPTPARSTPVAAAGPAASPARIPPTSATSTTSGATGSAGPGLTVRR